MTSLTQYTGEFPSAINSRQHGVQSCSNVDTASLGWTKGRSMNDHDASGGSRKYKGHEDNENSSDRLLHTKNKLGDAE